MTANAQGVPGITPSQITSSAQWNNTPDQTTSGQVQGIIAQNSPLMQQARTTALENMNGRGLLNSSMAETAGQSAVLGAATPIASADAAQASKVAQANFANQSQDQLTNLNAQNTAAGQNLAAAAQQNIANIEAQYKNVTQGSASASNLVNTAQNDITQILQNTNMDTTAKQTAINQITSNLKNSMGMVGALAGNVNLQQYLP